MRRTVPPVRPIRFIAATLFALGSLAACQAQSASGGPDGGPAGSGDAAVRDAAPDGAGPDGGSGGPAAGITVLVEPNGNHGAELVAAITGAHQSVYMTMYELDDAAVIAALVGRAQAGLDVQVVLDSSSSTKSFNTPAYTKLKTAGAKPVWSSSSFNFTHEKTVIIDGAVAWIMTMNGNTSSPRDNREYLAIDTNAADVAEATAVFVADHALHAITPSGPLVVANANARPRLVALIAAATTTLDVEGEEFSDKNQNGIVDAVAAAARRGVHVRVIIANSTLDSQAVASVKAAGAHVVMTGPSSGGGTPSNPYIHAKAILVDCAGGTCASGFVGSENFTAGSLGYNRELGVIFSVASELAKMKAAIDTDFAAGVAQ